MPKQVDHQARRAEIADAVCRLAARAGLDAVSLRHVAAEAGVSMGRVQHYFKTKDEMLLFAFRAIGERVERRMTAAIGDARPGSREFLRAFVLEMLPLSPESRAEAPALAAFLARAVVEPRLVEPLREGAETLTAFIAEQVGGLTEAVTLLALVDGLMLHLLTGQVSEDAALAAVDAFLDRVFG